MGVDESPTDPLLCHLECSLSLSQLRHTDPAADRSQGLQHPELLEKTIGATVALKEGDPEEGGWEGITQWEEKHFSIILFLLNDRRVNVIWGRYHALPAFYTQRQI